MCYHSEENAIFFTDNPLFEESQIYPAVGSVYMIDLDSKIMKPILYECLSYPSDITYDQLTNSIYIAETFMNRIIRLKQDNSGVYHTSVFYQFSGKLGPTALTVDDLGNVYTSRFEFVVSINKLGIN